MFNVEKLRAVAAAQIEHDALSGASLCVFHQGQEVFCEAFGWADASLDYRYGVDSLQITMSMAKGVIAALAARLIDRGQLEPGERVSRYWPEFAAAGKRDVTVAQLLSHQAGVPLLDGGLSLKRVADREALIQALAQQSPLWQPGTRHGYHAVTFGHYADALFERASGTGLCGLLAELRASLQLDIFCGLPTDQRDRAVRVLGQDASRAASPNAPDPTSLLFRVLTNFPEMLVEPQAFFNSDALRDACIPATNLYADARSLARLYAAMLPSAAVDQRLCSADAIAVVTREQVRGPDAVNPAEMAYAIGFQKPSAFVPFSSSSAAFGHCGVGGSVAFADPDAELAMAWIPSRLGALPCDARTLAVVNAVYAAL